MIDSDFAASLSMTLAFPVSLLSIADHRNIHVCERTVTEVRRKESSNLKVHPPELSYQPSNFFFVELVPPQGSVGRQYSLQWPQIQNAKTNSELH